MAINFGQQINQALQSSLNQQVNSKVRAQQLAEEMKQRQFNQEMKQMVQGLREREFQLSKEAQTEQMINNAMQNNLEQQREERLQEYYDARIANMGNEGSGSGSGGSRSDYLTVTEVQTNNNQIEQLSGKLKDINERLSQSSALIDNTANQEGVTMEEAMSDPNVKQAGQEKLSLEVQREKIREQIQDLRQRNDQLFGSRGESPSQQGSQQTAQPQQPSREDLPQITSRQEFDELAPGALFIGPDGEIKKKRE